MSHLRLGVPGRDLRARRLVHDRAEDEDDERATSKTERNYYRLTVLRQLRSLELAHCTRAVRFTFRVRFDSQP